MAFLLLSLSLLFPGDNILTAVSVARDCGMVGVSDKVLVAKTSPPTHDEPASLTFEPADTPDIITTNDQEVRLFFPVYISTHTLLAYTHSEIHFLHLNMSGILTLLPLQVVCCSSIMK